MHIFVALGYPAAIVWCTPGHRGFPRHRDRRESLRLWTISPIVWGTPGHRGFLRHQDRRDVSQVLGCTGVAPPHCSPTPHLYAPPPLPPRGECMSMFYMPPARHMNIDMHIFVALGYPAAIVWCTPGHRGFLRHRDRRESLWHWAFSPIVRRTSGHRGFLRHRDRRDVSQVLGCHSQAGYDSQRPPPPPQSCCCCFCFGFSGRRRMFYVHEVQPHDGKNEATQAKGNNTRALRRAAM